jgi:aminoglycoside 6-adenylyltransferase
MNISRQDDQIIDRLVRWAEGQPLVRAMLLTSSRAVPHAPLDALSDYDVILTLRDIQPFFAHRDWLEAFGRVLVLYRDPLILDRGHKRSSYVTQYDSGLKLDFSLWPVGLLQQIVADPLLPAEFDAGYGVLLDKDHLTDGLKPPTYRAYIPAPPTESEFLDMVEGFFHEATYVAKFLWRDDMMAAKHILENSMKQEHMRPVLEWQMEIVHHWSIKPGPYGRRLKRWLSPDLWAELERTYTGPDLQDNWEALFRTITLFRKVAEKVGQALGYKYPESMDRRTVTYLQQVRQLDRAAESFVANTPGR